MHKTIKNKYNIKYHNSKNEKFYLSVAKILKEKKVIGWFQENIELELEH